MVDASINLGCGFTIRHWHAQLRAGFDVRQPWPYWTNRRLINGVVSEPERLIGDAKLDIVIEGVQEDIEVWLDAETVSYDTWTDLSAVPKAIKRATTYGAVASLYARRTKTFQGRVIPTVSPVTVTVISEDEKAMRYWEDKRDKMLELYLSAQGAARLWVSTADEEPIFSMDDIPEEAEAEVPSWHEFILGQTS